MKAWFDLARRCLNLMIQLDARTVELKDAHRNVAYWKQLANDRYGDVRRLTVEVNEAHIKAEEAPKGMGNLVPAVVAAPPGAHDRANAVKLANRLATAHREIGRAEKRAHDAENALDKILADGAHADRQHDLERAQWDAERQQLVDEIERLKGNPS